MDDLTREGGLLITDLRGAVGNLNGTISSIRNDLLKPATFDRLDATLTNLQGATQSFKESSAKLGGVMTDARGAVAGAALATSSRTGLPWKSVPRSPDASPRT